MGVINSILTAVQTVTANAASSPGAQAQPEVQTQNSQSGSDTVELSEAQQVYQLYNQGLPIQQIATNLSLSVAVVNSYLNISGSSSS